MGLEVVSFAEFFGDNPRVAERSAHVATELAARDAHALALTLREIEDVGSLDLAGLDIGRVEEARFDLLYRGLLADREVGLLNDTQTSSDDVALRGLKLIVKPPEDIDSSAHEILEKLGRLNPNLFSVKTSYGRNTNQILGIEFPGCMFRLMDETAHSSHTSGLPRIHIYGESDYAEFLSSVRQRASFLQHRVIRLETTGGDLLQNPNFTPAGLALASAQ